MYVKEIFLSIQGESSYTGLPCVFIRLAGCNLDCAWCDTPEAREREDAREMTVDEIVETALSYGVDLVEVTGGEPLLQDDAAALATALLEHFPRVLLETNGSVDLSSVPESVVKVVDVKCPSSGHAGSFVPGNLDHIQDNDEIKFVIGDEADYEYARDFVRTRLAGCGAKVLFAPVTDVMNADRLAEWVLADRLKVRIQVQFHRYLWKQEKGR